jgi:hypothetical protein
LYSQKPTVKSQANQSYCQNEALILFDQLSTTHATPKAPQSAQEFAEETKEKSK